jgi:hypothetical protein
MRNPDQFFRQSLQRFIGGEHSATGYLFAQSVSSICATTAESAAPIGFRPTLAFRVDSGFFYACNMDRLGGGV